MANYANDNASRVSSITYPAATAENVTYTYNSTASGNKGIGRLTSLTDQSGSTSMVYDALGRITSETRVIGSQTYTTAYAYDAADHLTGITYPSGRIVTYARNALGQVSGVTTKQNSGASAVNVATGVTWKPMSDLLSGMTHGNGLATTAGYDLDYRLTSLLLQDGAFPRRYACRLKVAQWHPAYKRASHYHAALPAAHLAESSKRRRDGQLQGQHNSSRAFRLENSSQTGSGLIRIWRQFRE